MKWKRFLVDLNDSWKFQLGTFQISKDPDEQQRGVIKEIFVWNRYGIGSWAKLYAHNEIIDRL